MRSFLAMAVAAAAILAGCAGTPAPPTTTAPMGDQLPAVPATTSFHFANASAVDLGALTGANRAFATAGGYASIGAPTFEPTIGITASGAIFVTSLRDEGPADRLQTTHIIRGVQNGTMWQDVGPFVPGTTMALVPNSNDPFLYVDPWTDRVYNFDMCATLSGFCITVSDDDGATWRVLSVATGEAPALDHQSLAAAPAGELATDLYPNALVFCINRGVTITGSWCSSSFDGGVAWTPLVPGFPPSEPQCHGLSGHLVGSADGSFYRGNPSCDGPAVYRSDDGGLTWTQHEIPTDVGVLEHEVATAVDGDGNIHAFWVGADGLPYLASSQDRAETWGPVRMVGQPGVTAAGFPTLAAGDGGRVAFAYVGTTLAGGYDADQEEATWSGYIGIATDALAEEPLLTTVAVNGPEDPIATGACGNVRCGGLGDFIDIAIDPEGRPWAAFSHNLNGNAGIVGTLLEGPRLRGELQPLTSLSLDGPAAFDTTTAA